MTLSVLETCEYTHRPQPEPETHLVLATTHDHKVYRVSDDLEWGAAQTEWRKLDDLRLAGKMPHVKFYSVRSTDDPKYKGVTLSLVHRRRVHTRGFLSDWAAARKAWKLFAPSFRSRYDKSGSDVTARTGVQGTGGWYYWPNGETAAQGLPGIARLCSRRGMIVPGLGGKWFVVDLLED